MRIIILAAGKGERLYPLTRNCPKSLLDLGDGRTLLETQLDSIRACGVADVCIVTGYKAEQIESKVSDIKNINIRIVYNPFYATTNNLISAWLAWPVMDDDFILLNGDDVFHPRVLSDLLASSGEICMVIDRKEEYSTEDMKVITDGDRIIDVGKDIPLGDANGESIGMMRFRSKGSLMLRNTLGRMVRGPQNHSAFYLLALREIMQTGYAVNHVVCSQDDWAEIDIHHDLDYARSRIIQTAKHLKLTDSER